MGSVAVPDPHDDTVLDPLWSRVSRSHASRIELAVALVAAAAAAIGWPAGWALKRVVSTLIPDTLSGFPIAALAWSGVGLEVLTVLAYQMVYDPGGSFGQVTVLPWVCVQIAVAPLAAALYGVAEVGVAGRGSTQWWPLTPVQPPLTAEDAAAILGGYDLTGPGVVDFRPLREPGQRSRP
jgi:hypothetical protein